MQMILFPMKIQPVANWVNYRFYTTRGFNGATCLEDWLLVYQRFHLF
jgi:hypothetical protein